MESSWCLESVSGVIACSRWSLLDSFLWPMSRGQSVSSLDRDSRNRGKAFHATIVVSIGVRNVLATKLFQISGEKRNLKACTSLAHRL